MGSTKSPSRESRNRRDNDEAIAPFVRRRIDLQLDSRAVLDDRSAKSETVRMSSTISGADEASIIARMLDPETTPEEKNSLFQELHARYSPQILPLLRAYIGGDYLDVLQHVWLNVWTAIAKQQFDGKNFKPWLFRIARNAAVDFGRRAKRLPRNQELDFIPNERPASLSEDDEYRREVLAECLKQLAEKSRQIICARYSASLNSKQIAEQFGMTVGRVDGLVSESRAKLRACAKRKMQ